MSRSSRLTAYPNDLLQSPIDQRSASLSVRPGGAAVDRLPARLEAPVRALPRGIDGPTRAFTSLVARHHLSVGFAFVALALAIVLGAIHALAPGHGKTVMAAYLVGQRGTMRQAGLIGLTVTATHTAGVLALGLALSASSLVAPERLYPWLGLASGALLAVIGIGLLSRAVRARRYRHEHHHGHHHHHPVVEDVAPVRTRALVAMGFAGGLVPSPSALVVLLGAMALGRAWFGVVLVIAYGLGMAGTLTAAGVLLLRARGALDRRRGRVRGLARVASALPLATSSVIVVVGLALAARGVVAI
jgi:ABC-type nickel/cobalt efflux system permease component RcnA